MTADERRRYLKTILDQHSEAALRFRQSSDAFDRAVAGMQTTIAAIHESNRAQRDAMDAIIAANNAALVLFSDEA